MRSRTTHTFQMGQGKTLVHEPREYLALVDIESYPAFIGKEADHLDLMTHLFAQMKALTAVAWGAPHKALKIRLLVTEDDRIVGREGSVPCHTTANGWLRTQGQLCLTSHERLHDCAIHRSHGLLRPQRQPELARPQLLDVPAGLYSVLVLYHFPFPFGGDEHWATHPEPSVHYSIILRHYPFPAPRIAPIRLPGFLQRAA